MKRALCLCTLLLFACDDGGSNGAVGDAGSETDGQFDAVPDATPVPEGAQQIPGLSAPVDVRFDENGVLHVDCQTDDDCIAVQGYYHAAHRFVQMDIGRRYPAGRLAELVGAVVLDTDKASRHLVATRTGERVPDQMLAAADDRTRSALEAYARGVNAWLEDLKADRHGAKLNAEYDFDLVDKTRLDPWEPTDSIYATLLVVRQLTDSSAQDLFRGEMFATLPPDIAWDAFGQLPPSRSSILPRADDGSATAPAAWWKLVGSQARLAPVLDALRGARAKVGPNPARTDHAAGSNNWVVSPAKSASGHALLSNDPHLGLQIPSVWYLVHLRSAEGLHVAGSSMPGLPAVVIGHNDHIAWGFTTTYFDMSDVYVETLTPDGDGVMFEGEEVPFLEKTYTFEIAGAAPVTETFLYVPHHGPVLSVDRDAGTAITMRWTLQDADTDVNYLVALASATTVDEAKAAVRNLTTIGQNVVVADRNGDIGWFPYNRIPLRPWASMEHPAWLPLPGEGDYEWDAFVDYDDLPQAKNPAAGYLATANNDMTGAMWDGDPTNEGQLAQQDDAATGYRHERIVQRLAEREDHSIATMEDIVSDVHSLAGERMVPVLLAAVADAPPEGAGAAVLEALAAWDFECPTGLDGVEPGSATPVDDPAIVASSAGCAAFHVLFPRLQQMVFGDELAANDVAHRAYLHAVPNILVRPDDLAHGAAWWDDVSTEDTVETMADIVAAAMEDAGAFLTDELGPTPADWRWGRLHTVTLRAPLFSDAGLNIFDHGPFINDGGLWTVDVANPSGMDEDSYAHRSGASMRFVCEAPTDAAVHCTIQVPGGQRHFTDSPHYDDLFRKWLVNEPRALVPADWESLEATAIYPGGEGG